MSAQQPTLKEALDNSNPNTLATALAALGLGTILRSLSVQLIKQDPIAYNSGTQPQLSTLEKIRLPDGAKASNIRRAWARVGGVTGALTPQAYGATPATGQIAVAPNGDIVVLAADAITSLDVEYEPMRYEVAEVTLDCASNDLTLPDWITNRGVICLLSAVGNTGTQTGQKTVIVDGTRTTTDGQCNMNVLKTKVQFDATDAITNATVKVAIMPSKDANALLEAASTVY